MDGVVIDRTKCPPHTTHTHTPHTHTHTQGAGPYASQIKQTEDDIAASLKKVNELAGVKESDTGLATPALWDLPADKQALQSEEPLQVHPFFPYFLHSPLSLYQKRKLPA